MSDKQGISFLLLFFVLREQFGDFFSGLPGLGEPRQSGKQLSEAQLKRIAPNLDLFLWRPILADPPVYTMRDLREWVTLWDVFDAHEALDLRSALRELNEPRSDMQPVQVVVVNKRPNHVLHLLLSLVTVGSGFPFGLS